MSFPKYHSALFREFARLLEEAEQQIKDESVMYMAEEPHAHPERIGRIRGLQIAAMLAEKLDKQISGAS